MKTFEELIKNNYHLSCKELDDFFANLEKVTADILVGEWIVGYIFTKEGTGSWWETLVRYIPIARIYSKNFLKYNNVKAWVFRFCGIKISPPGTSAFLKEMEYRNKLSISMIYKHLPMVDHFRKVDNHTIMGIMETNGKLNLYFYLKKVIERNQ